MTAPTEAEASQDLKLTMAEDLIMEVLAARYRLGDTTWPFDKRCKGKIESLERKGLVNKLHSHVENTVRASLTARGKAEYLDPSYGANLANR